MDKLILKLCPSNMYMLLDFSKLKAEAEQILIQSGTLNKARQYYVQKYHNCSIFKSPPCI